MRRFYFGWYVVAVSMAVYMLVIGATFSSFGLFVRPVSAEFKLSRADMNTTLILLNLGNAFMAPLVGRALDRFSAKRIMMASGVLFGLCLMVLGLSTSLWLSAAVVALPLALALQGAGTLTMSVFVARWFTVQRGRAMALALLGLSVGGIVVAPIIGLLIEAQGWRTTLLIVGAAAGVLLLALSCTMRDQPGPNDLEPSRDQVTPVVGAMAPDATPLTMGGLLRMPQFWVIALAVNTTLGMTQAISISLVPLGHEEGLTILQATSLISISAAAGIAGKLTLAMIADKVDRIILLTSLFGLAVLMNAALLFSEGYVALLGCGVALGLSTGAITPAYYALLADRFGPASFGTVRGLMAPIGAILGLVAVRLAGEVFDRTGGYDAMFLGFIAIQIAAAALMLSTRLIRPATVVTRAMSAQT